MLKTTKKINVDRQVNLAFYALLILHLIPLFFGKYFPTQDGPSHLKNAMILKDMTLDPHSVYHQYFCINTNPNPNWLVHIFYAGLLIFLPAFIAEKLFLIMYVILLPLSFRYLVGQINPASSFISLLIFPFVYNITFYLGFFNFCFSLVLFFYALGYWLKYNGIFNFKRQFVFIIFDSLAYFSHPVSFFMLAIMIGTILSGWLYNDFKTGKKAASLFLKRLSGILIGFLPMVIFFLLFLKGSGSEIVFVNRDLKTFIPQLFQNHVLTYSGHLDVILNTVLFLILTGALICNLFIRIKTRKWYALDVLLLFLVSFIILTYFSPEEFAGGSVIFIRLILYVNIILIICLAVKTYHPRFIQYAAWSFFAFAVIFLYYRSCYFMSLQKTLSSYLSVESHISEGKTILPFVVTNQANDNEPIDTIRDIDMNVFLHVSDYISIDKKLLSLQNYEASSTYFPLKWKPGKDPSSFFHESGDSLTDSAISAYGRESGVMVDYVLLLGKPHDNEYVHKELGKHYKPVKGGSYLYRRKE
jgi:hypothetical protein